MSVTMQMQGIWLDTLSDLKPGIASWLSNIYWIQLDRKHNPGFFFFYSTSRWRNYLLHYQPKIAMQMTTFKCNHRIDTISWRQQHLSFWQSIKRSIIKHDQEPAPFWSTILCRLSHPNVELHVGISVAVRTCYCLIMCFKCSGEWRKWRNRKSLSEPQCNIVI